MYLIKASSEIKMAISIGQMNSYLKHYTDALLTLHGIPTTDYSHEVSPENLLAEITARKTLETAMWNLCQHAEAQDEKVAVFDDPEKLRWVPAVELLLEQEREQHECDGWAKADEYQEQAEELEETTKKLVDAVKKLHHHIITPSKTAEQSAERYDAIVEFAEETLAPYGGVKKREWYDPSDDEEETDDEEEEIARRNAEVGWKCMKCGPKSEDEDFAFHEVKEHQGGTLCLKCDAVATQ